MVKIGIVLAMSILFAVGLGACGSRGGAGRGIEDYFANRELLYGTTIYISHFVPGIMDADQLHVFAAMFMEDNPGITIEIRRFNDRERMRETIGLEMMAGDSADVLINSQAFDWRAPAVSARLADWFEIMAADPDFSEDDWFMNIFHAFAVADRLPVLPFYFNFGLVSASNYMDGAGDAFARHETIDLSNMMQIYETYSNEYQRIFHTFNPYHAVMLHIGDFLDLDTGRIEFNTPEFVDFITQMGQIAEGLTFLAQIPDRQMLLQQPFAFPIQLPNGHHTMVLEEISRQFAFAKILAPACVFFLFDFQSNYGFTGAAPFANEAGELIIDSFRTSFALNANASPAQQIVAWEFMQFMQNPENAHLAMPYRVRATSQPIHKPLFRYLANHYIDWSFAHYAGLFDINQTNNIIYTLENIASIPARHIAPIPEAIQLIILETIMDFHDNLITPRQAAEYLQNRITIVLMEMGIL